MLCYVVELLIGRTDYMESEFFFFFVLMLIFLLGYFDFDIGKRQAEEEIKEVSSKKQKVDEVAAKQKVLKEGSFHGFFKVAVLIKHFCVMV